MFRVKIWGARGSLPSPLPVRGFHGVEGRVRNALENYVAYCQQGQSVAADSTDNRIDAFLATQPAHRFGGYGGNTPCVEVGDGESSLIIDGGSGIRLLGYDIMAPDPDQAFGSLRGPGLGQGEFHILFTHFHWDHLMGLPFFTPMFIPGNTIHVYAVQPELSSVFETIFKKPYFPVPLKNLGAKIVYHKLEAYEPCMIQGFKVTPYQLDHPDPCFGFKIQKNGKTFSHCVDTECTRFSREDLGRDLPLYQDVDLMTFDAQYTILENLEKVNWGHAAAWLGLDIAMREGVKKIVFMHHDPAASDEKIAAVESQTARYHETRRRQFKDEVSDATAQPSRLDWTFAREGQVFEV